MLVKRSGSLSRLLALSLVATLLLAEVAFAAPVTAPSTIMQTGFEEASFPPAGLTLSGTAISPALWARGPFRVRNGTFGLYCAGSSEEATTYPQTIATWATLDLADLEHYYSASVNFYYTMPSLGLADGDAFKVKWYVKDDPFPAESRKSFALTAPNAWQGASFDISAPADQINLSRTPGTLEFSFSDFGETTGLEPRTGEGVSIDDVSVTGWKYGPVRSLSSSGVNSVQLSWAAPFSSTVGTAVDDRPISYEVWRTPAGETNWSLLGDTTNLSYSDTTGTQGVLYTYLVQARDAAGVRGMPAPGISAMWNGVTPAPNVAVTQSANKASLAYGENVTITYTVTNTGNVPLTDVRIETGTMFGTITKSDALNTTTPWSFTKSKSMTASTSAAVTAHGSYGGQSVQKTASAIPLTVAPQTPPASPPTRISGANRFETAVKISQAAFPNASSIGAGKAVVIASGLGWADALPASSLAGAVGGPLLLVTQSDVPDAIAKEVARLKTLGVTKAYVVGGDSVVGSKARDELKRLLGTTPIQVAGANRYATSLKVAETTRALRDGGMRTTGGVAFVATGLNFPDALAASSLAASLKAPIVLTHTGSVPPETLQALANLQPQTIVICGGTSTITSAVETKLKSIYGAKVTRKAGNTRYDTAKAIISYGKTLTGVSSPAGIFLATGANYPDALAGGVLAGIGRGLWTPLMLTTPQSLSPQAVSFIQETPSLGFASVLGGTVSVSEGVRIRAVELTK